MQEEEEEGEGLKGKLTGPGQALRLIASYLQLQGMHPNPLYFEAIQDLLYYCAIRYCQKIVAKDSDKKKCKRTNSPNFHYI